ncbi:MAG: YbeD family protein [Gammaproteobacteria bacterium]
MNEHASPLQFPCRFPIKAMGKNRADFDVRIVEIISRHAPEIHEGAVKTRPSQGGKYTSVTVTIQATSQRQLDNIYQDLTACSEVLLAL